MQLLYLLFFFASFSFAKTCDLSPENICCEQKFPANYGTAYKWYPKTVLADFSVEHLRDEAAMSQPMLGGKYYSYWQGCFTGAKITNASYDIVFEYKSHRDIARTHSVTISTRDK